MKLITDDGKEIKLEEQQFINLVPGDTVIFHIIGISTPEEMVETKQVLQKLFPSNNFLVIDGRYDVDVLRRIDEKQ
jgi:hypothetical protein